MSIIDNIPAALEDYGIRWKLVYENLKGRNIDLRILERGYSLASPTFYTDAEITYLVDIEKYIPVATHEELNAVRTAQTRTFGAGTIWENTYATTGLAAKYIQVADIDLTAETRSGGAYWNSGAGWDPITTFTGTYNGGGHVIVGMMIYRPLNTILGMFGYMNGGKIYNLFCKDVDITALNNAGAFAGRSWYSSEIKNCISSGAVRCVGATGQLCGGISGYNRYEALIENCYSLCITTSDYIYVGGITAANFDDAVVKDCYSVGYVNTPSMYFGGCVGRNLGTVTNCYYNSETSGQSDTGKGTPLTTAQMYALTAASTGWDEAIWAFGAELAAAGETVLYPQLRAHWRYELEPAAYTGGSIELDVQQSFADKDVFRPIAGTIYNLRLYDFTGSDFKDLRNATNRQFYFEYRRDGAILGCGFILPETYEHDWGSSPDLVSIGATCGLGLLKDIPFLNNDKSEIIGLERIKDVITFLLHKAGLMNNWLDGVRIRPELGETAINGFAYNTYVDTERWIGANCEDVLTDLLTSVNAQIVRRRNDFYIRHLDQPGTLYAVMWNWDGALVSTGLTFNQLYTVQDSAQFDGRGILRVEKPVRSVTINYPTQLIENLLDRRDWEVRLLNPTPDPFHTINEDGEIIIDPAAGALNFDLGYFRPALLKQIQREMPVRSGFYRINLEAQIRSLTETPAPGFNGLAISMEAWTATGLSPQNYEVKFFEIPSSNFNNWQSFEFDIRVGQAFPETDIVIFSLHGLFILPDAPPEGQPSPDIHSIHYRNIKVVHYGDRPMFRHSGFEDVIEISDDNTELITTEKIFGHQDAIKNIASFQNSGYKWDNVFFSRLSGIIRPVKLWQLMPTGEVITLPSFIRSGYYNYYSKNKYRYSLSLFNTQSLPIEPYAIVRDNDIDQDFIISSMTYEPKFDRYQLELIGFRGRDWILDGGIWNDLGVWIDTELWEDS